MNKISINLFLESLDSSDDATFNIEHFTDLPKGQRKPTPDPLVGRYANLTRRRVEELLPRLKEKNEAKPTRTALNSYWHLKMLFEIAKITFKQNNFREAIRFFENISEYSKKYE